MPLDPRLEQLIRTKREHTRAPQWALPIAEVRQGFRQFWTPAIAGEPASISRIEDAKIPDPGGSVRARAPIEARRRADA